MRVVIQRVSEASVKIDGKVKAKIGKGLLIFLGIEDSDGIEDITKLTYKITRLRIFADEAGKMNLPITDIMGKVMVVSQFTLHASTVKGSRPSFIRAAKPEFARMLYEMFVKQLEKELSIKVATGEFGADMKISLTNDGPVTIIIDTKNWE
jgi:D-tyrosyl-tRNA(Tyr) deacylase